MVDLTEKKTPQRQLKSPTSTLLWNNLPTGVDKSLFMSKVAVDPITLTINECIIISSAMRKMNRWSQSGVAAILGGSELFGEDELISSLGISSNLNNNNIGRGRSVNDNPLLSSFLQLKSILCEAKSIYDIDSLTILQPFLLIIKSSSTSGAITSLALDSIAKFINYDIISFRSKNLQNSLIQINSALTHCRFEAADQNSDDAVLLKVLRLMETVITSPLSNYLPNEVVSEVIQTCLSLACNKRRSEVLRKAAEMTISLITARVFRQLRIIVPETESSDNIQTDFSETVLPEDVIGSANADVLSSKIFADEKEIDKEETQHAPVETEDEKAKETEDTEETPAEEDLYKSQHEQPFNTTCINEFMVILISMISPSNQYQHMESTRVLALSLVNTAIEVSGNDIPSHQSLLNLIADPVSKHVLLIITTTDSPPLLQAALKLFTTMAIVLRDHLKSQIELTFTLVISSIVPGQQTDALKGNSSSVGYRVASSKEMILESLSLLWTRDPYYFTKLFIDFDCHFDKSDLAKQMIEFICKLSLPESAKITTDNVPPICLEGLLTFISGVNDRVKTASRKEALELPKLLVNKRNKNAFVRCTDVFNKKPSQGIKELVQEGFIKDENNLKEVAAFIYNKSGRLNKKVLGEYLAKPSNKDVLKEFIALFNYEGIRVDEAIRLLLKTFRLPGESQQIERIVELFAERYAECQENYVPENEEEFVKPNSDSVFVLSYSIILLNTDLHNPQVKKQMTLDAYRRNLKGTFNGGDYPEWYLAKIYSSIKDREIIMPEEHHGTDKWFDDVWHNLISSQTTEEDLTELSLSEDEISLYDKTTFEENIEVIIDTLVYVFKEATDDHIITRLMSTIDKCVNICLFYDVETSIDKLIGSLADLTMLSDSSYKLSDLDDNVRNEIPITQIKIESKDEAITVSEMAVWFGRDFKAQISTVVLFRLIKKTGCKITGSWNKVLKIILTFFENCLINPNLFTDFQATLGLAPLPKVNPRYIINRAKPLKESGLLSTFSSFLKGYSDEPPEPTDQEVESTLSSIDCINSLNIAAIFHTIAQADDSSKIQLSNLLLGLLPEYSDKTKRFYETELLFIFEIVVNLALSVKDNELLSKTSQQIHLLRSSNDISKKGHIRFITYELFLLRTLDNIVTLDEILVSLIELDKEVLTKHGRQVIQPLNALLDGDANISKEIAVSENYWKALRVLGSIPLFAEKILLLTQTLVKDSIERIVPGNFMLILGLLDEISSIGALASQWEQESENKDSKDSEYLKELIDVSKRSITLTSEMMVVIGKEGFNRENSSYPLIQALAHQCFNPCREIRTHGLNVLKSTVVSAIESHDDLEPYGVFEFGLFPLIGELSKTSVIQTDPNGFISTQIEALSILSKVFLQFIGGFTDSEIEKVWFGILDGFKTFDDIRNKHNKNDEATKESGSELIKNMILVLQTSDILSNMEFWDKTWTKVEVLYPGLKQELGKEPEPLQTEPLETESVE